MNFNELNHTYLIAEIGINHNGSVDFIKKIIDYAVIFEWNCVKLQKRTPEICVPDHQKDKIYSTPWGDMPYIRYREKIELSESQYYEIFEYAKQKNIDCTASVWDIPSLDFMLQFPVPFVKIPSAHLTNTELIAHLAQNYKPTIFSTGMSTIDDIILGTNIILKEHHKNYALLHCNSSYPAPEDNLNLRMIQTLKKNFDCTVGYSGHEFGISTTLAAVALGAEIIERHVTLKRTMWGSDQMCSLEPVGMLKLATQTRILEKALGDGEKKIYPEEKQIMRKLRRIANNPSQ